MTTAKKTVFMITLLALFIATPVFAGIDPFYKGDWGMAADEIKALHQDGPPDAELGQMMVYVDKSDGAYAETTYFFADNALTAASYLVKGDFAKEKEIRKWLKDLGALMVAPDGAAFTSETKEKKLADGIIIILYLWKNDNTQILGRAYINNNEKNFDLEFSFTDITNPAINDEPEVIINSLDDVAQDIYDSFSK